MNQALKSNVIVPGILPVVMLPDLNDLLSDAHDLGSFNPRTKNFQAGGLLQVVSVVDFKSQWSSCFRELRESVDSEKIKYDREGHAGVSSMSWSLPEKSVHSSVLSDEH